MRPSYAYRAIEACFKQLSVEALYIPIQGTSYPIRLLTHCPDKDLSFNDSRILTSTHVFEIAADLCPHPLRGDRIQIEGEVFTIQHVESHDPLQLIWTIEAAKQ